MILGDFQFSLKTMTPNSITRTTEYNWPDADRIGDIPNLQNLGMSSDKIEIEGVFYPKLNAGTQYNSIEKLIGDTVTKQVKSAAANFFGFGLDDSFSGYNSLNDLRNSKLCKIASNLISDNGEILGKFVITTVKETQSYFDKNGDAQKEVRRLGIVCFQFAPLMRPELFRILAKLSWIILITLCNFRILRRDSLWRSGIKRLA